MQTESYQRAAQGGLCKKTPPLGQAQQKSEGRNVPISPLTVLGAVGALQPSSLWIQLIALSVTFGDSSPKGRAFGVRTLKKERYRAAKGKNDKHCTVHVLAVGPADLAGERCIDLYHLNVLY